MSKPELGWAIVDAHTGALIVFDGRMPVYWRRRVAQDESNDHGLTYSGDDRDVRIVRVQIRRYLGGKA